MDVNLLVVEDDLDDFHLIESILKRQKLKSDESYNINHVRSLQEALHQLKVGKFDAVILDLGLPDSRGLDTLKALQEHNIRLPMVVLTELEDQSFAARAMRLGFEDYVPKALLQDSRLDWQLVQAMERHKVTLDYYERATTDRLTGVHNRNYFDEAYENAVSEHNRSKQSMALVLLDLDDFKAINDTHGHQLGDKVLTLLGDALNNTRRREDMAARLGGDEFALLLPQVSSRQGCEKLVERLQASFEKQLSEADLPCTPTLSIGVALHEHGESAEHLYKAADNALYRVKNSGKAGFSLA